MRIPAISLHIKRREFYHPTVVAYHGHVPVVCSTTRSEYENRNFPANHRSRSALSCHCRIWPGITRAGQSRKSRALRTPTCQSCMKHGMAPSEKAAGFCCCCPAGVISKNRQAAKRAIASDGWLGNSRDFHIRTCSIEQDKRATWMICPRHVDDRIPPLGCAKRCEGFDAETAI